MLTGRARGRGVRAPDEARGGVGSVLRGTPPPPACGELLVGTGGAERDGCHRALRRRVTLIYAGYTDCSAQSCMTVLRREEAQSKSANLNHHSLALSHRTLARFPFRACGHPPVQLFNIGATRSAGPSFKWRPGAGAAGLPTGSLSAHVPQQPPSAWASCRALPSDACADTDVAVPCPQWRSRPRAAPRGAP